ncbi:DUF4129 domain-containing protein [Desulfotomaculum sp. 1211_IL3151]|uniref:DUF4129 domain-containing protein n=1 Tax=Desulfotomaculum sp. 1211_IL3151 TaxID=3084055 RepID=UPI002FDADE85
MTNRIQLTLLAISVEIAYLYPIYYLIALGMKTPLSAITSFATVIALSIITVLLKHLLISKKWSYFIIWSGYLFFYIFIGGLLFNNAFHQQWSEGILFRLQMMNLLVFYFWIWLRTGLLARKTWDYTKAVSHFEVSLVIMFIVLMIAELLGMMIPHLVICMLLVLFGSFVMLSMIKPGHEKIKPWAVTLYFGGILLPIMMVASLFQAYLYGFSTNLFGLAQPFATYLVNILAIILKFLLGKNDMVPQRTDVVSESSTTELKTEFMMDKTSGETSFVVEIMLYLLIAGMLIALIVGILYLLGRIWRKAGQTQTPQKFVLPRVKIIPILISLLRKIYLLASLFLPVKYGVGEAYYYLLKWASQRNYPKAEWETPYEFCNRLCKQFPRHIGIFKIITDNYVQYSYGHKQITSKESRELKRMIGKLYFSL